MSDGADIVILSQREEPDPRNDEKRATVRVVLHRTSRRVLVDLVRGSDATGAPLPVRVDPHEPESSAEDIRGAYGFLEQSLADWYDRALKAERRATEAEARATRAESRGRAGYIGPALPAADPKAVARQKFEKLVALANGSPSEHEAGAAALAAVRMMREHSLTVK